MPTSPWGTSSFDRLDLPTALRASRTASCPSRRLAKSPSAVLFSVSPAALLRRSPSITPSLTSTYIPWCPAFRLPFGAPRRGDDSKHGIDHQPRSPAHYVALRQGVVRPVSHSGHSQQRQRNAYRTEHPTA